MKDELVDAAYQHLLAQGFDNLSAIGISAACGVSKRTFYKTFASLDEFLDLLMDKICAAIRTEFAAFLSPGLAADAASIEALFTRMPRLFGRYFEKFMLDLRKVRPDLVQKLLTVRRAEFRLVAEKIIAAAGKSVAKRNLSTRVAADMLQTLVDQLATPQYLLESGENMPQIAHTIAQIYLNGLLH